MTRTEYLEKLISESKYKRSYIAERLGISVRTFYNKVHNVSEFTAREINTLCELLDIKDNTLKVYIFFGD